MDGLVGHPPHSVVCLQTDRSAGSLPTPKLWIRQGVRVSGLHHTSA